MAKNRQLGKLRLTTWILAFIMLLASCGMILSACSGTTDNEDDTTETPTDTQTFSNANFEFFDDSDGTNLIASPDNWTLSSQGSASAAKSGIVDTSMNWGEQFKLARRQYEILQDEDSTEEDTEDYFTDIEDDHDMPGWDLANAKLGEDDEDLTYETISNAEIDAVNPGTHYAADDEKKDEETHVLMLHNYRTSTSDSGTAARYASSSVTVPAGSAVKVSVWVKTYGLKYNNNTDVDGNRGAYIEIANTVGEEQDPLVIQNIDTQKLNTQNNDYGWVQYTVYLKASSYASTTFTVYLGLGRTNSVDDNQYEYVQGYAFFDDLKYEVMTASEYDAAVSESGAHETYLDVLSTDGSDKKFDAISGAFSSVRNYALDCDVFGLYEGNNAGVDQIDLATGIKPAVTDAERNGKTYTLADYIGADNAALLTATQADDINKSGVISSSSITTAAGYAQSVVDDFAKFNDLFGADTQILMLYSAKGAPYKAVLNDGTEHGSTANVQNGLFTVAKDETLMIRFWVKTSAMNGATGGTVTLVNYETNTAIGAVDTTTLSTVDISDDNGTTEDIFDGWQQCYFFVSNDTDKDEITFTLEFNFGPTNIVDTAFSAYADGYAAFTGFEYTYLSDEEASLASTGTYAVNVALTDDPDNADSSVVFDDPAYTDGTEGSAAIESGFADPRNYKGVYGDSEYVGGSSIDTSGEKTASTSGLINKKYADNYWGSDENSPAADWLSTINTSYTNALTKSNWWDTVFGNETTQPLLIVNTVETAARSFGYIGAETTISASSYAQVTLRVKMSANATAYIYLIDASAESSAETRKYSENLTYSSGISYRYDEDGNVVTKDPDDKDFDADTDTLFYKQDNGLWSTTERHSGDVYYANLSNYDTDDDGNYIDSDGNIVYYLHDGAFYRYHNEDNDTYSVRVNDFKNAQVDADRLAAATLQSEQSKELVQVIKGTPENANKWINVSFLIANGAEEKTYRLEVWSGSRDNQTQMAGESYVIFDQAGYTELDQTTFDALVEEDLQTLGRNGAFGENYTTTDDILEAYKEDPTAFIGTADSATSLIYYHFSLFDSLNYAPYDENNDLETRESDPYADYDASSYSDTVAYLKFSDSEALEYTAYINYGASEIDVATSDGSTDDGTTEDTAGGGSETNLWLLIPSIILAAALFVTLISLLVKRLLANIRKNKVRNTPQYNAQRSRYVRKLKLAEESDDADDKPEDDVLPDDDDEITEEDIYRVEDAENTPEDTDPYADESDSSDKKDEDGENK